MHIWDKPLVLVGAVSGVYLAALIVKRRLHTRFPFFFIYVISVVAITIVRFATLSHPWPYFVAFSVTEALYAILSLLALHEIFRRVFFDFYGQFLWFRLLFPAVILLALGIVVWDGLRSPPAQAIPLLRLILLFGMAVNFIQVGLFCMFWAVAAFFRLRWLQVPLGISLGFAIAAIGALAGYWLRSEFGTKAQILIEYVPPVAYILAIAIWLLTFLRPAPEPNWASVVNLDHLVEEIRQDTAAMKKFLEKMK